MILSVVIALLGGTLAYWNWQSTNAQKTNVTFTVNSTFSCSANGGGNITSNDIMLAPADCTNSTYAIQRTVTTNITNNGSDPVYMDLWLNVVSIGSGLSNSQNFKYALTTDSTSCTNGVVSSGNFYGKANGSKVNLLSDVTSGSTYYLYIWLDSAETSTSTMNQSVNLTLGGECTNEEPNEQTVYTANLYDDNVTGYNVVWIGQTIPAGMTTYNTPALAITALETAYSTANSGATASLPFFLRHTISDGSLWCATEYDNGVATGISACAFQTQAACNSTISNWAYDDITYSCVQNDFTGGVSESYVGFVVTSEMASANPGMTAGTYYLRGGVNEYSLTAANREVFIANAKTIYDAFGGVGCSLDGNSGGNPYTTTPSSNFNCSVSGLYAYAYSYGYVVAADGAGSRCIVYGGGGSSCDVYVDDGGGGGEDEETLE